MATVTDLISSLKNSEEDLEITSLVEHFEKSGSGVLLTSDSGECLYINAFLREALGGQAELGSISSLPLESIHGAPLLDLEHAQGCGGEWSGVCRISGSANGGGQFLLRSFPLGKCHLCLFLPLAEILQTVDDSFHWQKFEVLGTLAGGISHDFNNLISLIQGNVQLALRRLPQDSPVLGLMDNVMAAVRTARGLSEQILAFSRSEAPRREIVDGRSVVREAVRLLSVGIPKGIECVVDITEIPLLIEINASQLAQLILNLGTNALQAMGSGPGTLSVVVRSRPAEGGDKHPVMVIEISDTGAGIDAVHLPRIFDPFFTTKASSKGTGLGLVMVKQIVQLNDGKISVTSRPNEGTSFIVEFPLFGGAS